MKRYLILLTILAFSCSPKNEEVTDEQVDISPPEAALDSVVSAEKDGTTIDQTDEETDVPIPQPVLQLLSQQYPGYKKPKLIEEIIKKHDEEEQGPYLVSGYFTNDTYLDHALQLQHNKNVYIVAALDTGGNKWSLHELKRDIMFNDRGTLRSVYRLILTKSGKSITDQESDEKLELKRDAISVGFEDNVTTYVYRDNRFRSYLTAQ